MHQSKYFVVFLRKKILKIFFCINDYMNKDENIYLQIVSYLFQNILSKIVYFHFFQYLIIYSMYMAFR